MCQFIMEKSREGRRRARALLSNLRGEKWVSIPEGACAGDDSIYICNWFILSVVTLGTCFFFRCRGLGQKLMWNDYRRKTGCEKINPHKWMSGATATAAEKSFTVNFRLKNKRRRLKESTYLKNMKVRSALSEEARSLREIIGNYAFFKSGRVIRLSFGWQMFFW